MNYRQLFSTIIFIGFTFNQSFAHAVERINVSSTGVSANRLSINPSISADGRFVAFMSSATNLANIDATPDMDIYVRDRVTGLTEIVSKSSQGLKGNNHSRDPAISADGRIVAFWSDATNLVSGDTNSQRDIFVHDRITAITERISVSNAGVQTNGESYNPSLNADGQVVVFWSDASNLVNNDTNDRGDVFVHDRNTGQTENLSVSAAGGAHYYSAVSADGRFVAFSSSASIIVHDRNTGLDHIIDAPSPGLQGYSGSYSPSLSADGRFVAFESFSNNLVSGDTSFVRDIFVRDRLTGSTERVNVSMNGVQANSDGYLPSISADGRFVLFHSLADNLVGGDTNKQTDLFIHDRNTGITRRTNLSSNGEQLDGPTHNPSSVSADGRFVAFYTLANNIVDSNGNQGLGVFLFENNPQDFFDLSANVYPTSGTVKVDQKLRFRARLKNNTGQTLKNCKIEIVKPVFLNGQRQFSFYSWPLAVAKPKANAAVDIAPGETQAFNLFITPKVAMRREIQFEYDCKNIQAFTLPFANTVHISSKTEPLIAEDGVQLRNGNNKTELVIDRANSKYWSAYVLKVKNTSTNQASISLTTQTGLAEDILRKSRLCETVGGGNNKCLNPVAEQIQIELAAGQTKNVFVFNHAHQSINRNPRTHRLNVEARDQTGEIVAKNSIGIYTQN